MYLIVHTSYLLKPRHCTLLSALFRQSAMKILQFLWCACSHSDINREETWLQIGTLCINTDSALWSCLAQTQALQCNKNETSHLVLHWMFLYPFPDSFLIHSDVCLVGVCMSLSTFSLRFVRHKQPKTLPWFSLSLIIEAFCLVCIIVCNDLGGIFLKKGQGFWGLLYVSFVRYPA